MEQGGEERGGLVGRRVCCDGEELKGEMGEVGHLRGTALGVEEGEDVGVEVWEAVAEERLFHGTK